MSNLVNPYRHAGSADPLFFEDTFTESSDTILESHTPDTGTGWTELIQIGTEISEVIASTDRCEPTSGSSSGIMHTADATYPSANYEVTLNYIDGDTLDDMLIMAVRIQDSNNMYAVRVNKDDGQLYKKVSGTWSTVGASFSGVSAGSILKLKINGTTLSFEDDGVELRSVTVSDHASAGKAGLGFGAIILSGDDTGQQGVDDFKVTDLG